MDQLVIAQLPEMMRAAAEGLQGANLTVLDGADGLTSVVASLAGQGLALLNSVRSGLDGQRDQHAVAVPTVSTAALAS